VSDHIGRFSVRSLPDEAAWPELKAGLNQERARVGAKIIQ
jgi:hypothetical protein